MNPKFLDLGFRLQASGVRKKTFRALTLGVFFLAPGPWLLMPSPAYAQSAEDILQAVRQAEMKAEYSATQFVQSGDTREVAKIYRDGLKRRIEWLQPSVKNGDVLVDDGQNVSIYHRAENTLTQTQSARRAPVFASSGWKVGAATRQNGRLIRTLRHGNGRELTVDEQTKVIIRNENGRSITALENLDFGAVPAAKFAFSPPSGVKITRLNGKLLTDLNMARRQANWFKVPSQIPAGYKFESAVVAQNEVWLRYSSSQKRFSIFEQKTDEADLLPPKKVGGGWFWKQSGVRYLATDVPAGAVESLASSLK